MVNINKGPGAYVETCSLNKEGKYVLGKYPNSGVRSFPHGVRKFYDSPSPRNKMPGPGEYKLPSDFGYPRDFKKL